jgi:hypothetical protein
MDESLHNEERILKYLDGLMEPGEKLSFEQELAANPSLREATESLRLSINAVQLMGTRERVASIHNQMINEVSPGRRKAKVVPLRKMMQFAIGAAAGIILSLLGYFGYKIYHLSPESLYNESYVAYDPSSVTRGDTPAPTEIQRLYSAQDHQSVISQTKGNEESLSPKDRLMVAIAYLETDQPEPAIKRLEQLSKEENNYKPDAEYYLALAYLKNKDYDKSIALMRSIHENPSHIYQQQFSRQYIRKVSFLKWK